MTRAEFVEKNACLQKTLNHANKWLLGFLAVFAFFFIYLDKYGHSVPEEVRGSILVFSLFAGLFGIVIFFGRRTAKRRRELGLFCPHCNKDFLGISFQITAASGRCGRCGGVILEDWNK
jgi:hypothetical protein